MLDVKLLQNDFETVQAALEKKHVDSTLVSTLRTLSLGLKEARQALETLQAEQNAKSKSFGMAAKNGGDIEALKAELSLNKALILEHTQEVRDLEERLEALALSIPNMPDPSVPEGKDEEENIILKTVLTPPTFTFTPKEHWDIDAQQEWIDFARGVKLSKSRFSVLKGQGARLSRALINYMLDFNRARGFEEVAVPYIVNRPTLTGTGQLPKFEDDLFKIEGEDLFLIPTAEVPVTNLYYDEILLAEALPLCYTAATACFRKEAGSAGRDTRGMIRQHQFDKVELVALTHPSQSEAMFERMVACASDLLSSLGLAHRHVLLCGGDLGFSAAKTIDLEVWFPGQNRYREISSISNTRDFQARRAKIRFKDGKKNTLVHTLNGSSLAVGRTLIAIMENYQNEDGTIAIPEVLKAYM
ncbi:serine--tRNA ligase [Sulfurospirillum sp. T05]|uniref:Serine--tRNA ligase n=1 Tax=Sulfurospirillum tamanense TaxID=2813362 RepID=A0ABS2WU32_9BACT|nr:serine--tRNA ligase [Sulfurospirillum tamanensis]MBN2965164.1 serine--tRNA ligase [Sulfurospirillum tamanensis]